MDEKGRLARMITALIQPEVFDCPEDNLAEVFDLIDQAAAQQADLVILPELWNTPFINAKILEHADEWTQLTDALCQKARLLGIWIIAGSLPLREDGKLFNASCAISDQGEITAIAKKIHLLEVHTRDHAYRESDVFDAGDTAVSFETPWGRIGIVICFDIRFPEVSRKIAQDCFMVAVPAGFNEAVGRKHWQPLLQARAIENEVFVCGVNPAAKDWGSYRSYGHSMIVDPDGEIVSQIGSERGICLAEIDPKKAEEIRARSPYWKLRKQF